MLSKLKSESKYTEKISICFLTSGDFSGKKEEYFNIIFPFIFYFSHFSKKIQPRLIDHYIGIMVKTPKPM
jgi:hypothetical protein